MKQEIDNNAMWAAFRQELALQGELQVVTAIDNALNNLGFTIKETSTIIPIPLKQGEQPKKHDVCDNCDQQGSCVSPCPMKLVEKQGEQKSEEVDNLHNYLYGEQESSEWSDEDEAVLDALIRRLEGEDIHVSPHLAVKCLKSIKGRVQPRQKWSEEDENMLKFILTDYRTRGAKEDSDIITWLKSLRPQKQDVMSVDEFKHIVGYLVQDIVANEHMAEAEKQPTNFFVEKYYNKLRPQSQWKPSDEQMWALSTLANIPESASDTCKKTAQELLEELKKLK